MKNIFIFLALLFLLSCTSQNTKIDDKVDKVVKAEKYVTLKSLDSIKENDTVFFKSPDGKSYLVTNTAQTDDESEESMESSRAAASASKIVNKPCTSEDFDGTDRKKAKLSFATAKEEAFANLGALMAILPSDNSMGSTHIPAITTTSTSNRVKEEKRNVHVLQTYIYAFSRESDEDYHVIIGTTNNKNNAVFFNAEISGLPPSSSSSYPGINNARKKFSDYFGLKNNCHGGYITRFIDQPVKVELKGSLFFDKLHYDNHASIGTKPAKPATYWEIHPVNDIVFL
jgi:hypothetical protein